MMEETAKEARKEPQKVKKLSRNMVLMRSRGDSIDQVKKLNLWGQSISDVSLVKQMPDLEVVTLSLNAVERLQPFSHCRNLQQLYLRSNNVSDLGEICHLKELDNLTRLWLSDNPCTETPNYRHTVIKTLPQLTLLDNVEITEDEREDAAHLGQDLVLKEDEEKEEEEEEAAAEVVRTTESAVEGENATASATAAAAAEKEEEVAAEAVENGPPGDGPKAEVGEEAASAKDAGSLLSLEETNKMRAKLGLQPLSVSKVCPPVRKPQPSADYNVRTAVLHLIKELDRDSLEVVMEAIKYRLKTDFAGNENST